MLIWILAIIGVAAFILAAFAICDLRKQNKKRGMKNMYYCNVCEQFNANEDCPICLSEGAKMPASKAEKFLFDVNASRMTSWIGNNRIMPECE